MKKLITFTLIVLFLFMFGCAEKTQNNVSYIQNAALYGTEGDIRVVVRAGEKENPIVADGKKGGMSPFCTLTVRPLSSVAGREFTYSFTVDGKEYSGDLRRDRFGNSYSADLGEVEANSLTSVTIRSGDTEYVVSLDNMMGDLIIDSSQALNIAFEELKGEIEAEKADGKTREIHIKFINDGNNPASRYYWYIAFIGENSDYWALLIDPETGEVVAKRT